MRDVAGLTESNTEDAIAGSDPGELAAARAGPDSGKDRWNPEAHAVPILLIARSDPVSQRRPFRKPYRGTPIVDLPLLRLITVVIASEMAGRVP